MSVHGCVPNSWAKQFKDDYIPLLLNLILDAWVTFRMPTDRFENLITKKLCAHLRNNKDRDKHFFRIDWESPNLNKKGDTLGRVDLKVTDGNCDEHIYFSIECKRLHVTFPSGRFCSLAPEYVKEGMYRYFNGQYAIGLNKGGMLGYVMDGDISKAIDNVEIAIESQRSILCMQSASILKRSSLINKNFVRETHHIKSDKSPFTIHHIFLPATKDKTVQNSTLVTTS